MGFTLKVWKRFSFDNVSSFFFGVERKKRERAK
jgi:hypothetical protein